MQEKSQGENSYVNEPFLGRTRFGVPFADIIAMGRVEMTSLRGGLPRLPALRSARAPAGGGVYISVLGPLSCSTRPGSRPWSGWAEVGAAAARLAKWVGSFSRNIVLAGPRGDLPGARPAVTVPGKRAAAR